MQNDAAKTMATSSEQTAIDTNYEMFILAMLATYLSLAQIKVVVR